MNDFEQILDEGLHDLGISIDNLHKQKIFNFITILQKWNKFYNLTAIKGIDLILSYHILDSLSILKYLNNKNLIADIGTGSGMPGIPLAILKPNSNFVLFDSNSKKASFIENVILELELKNVAIENIRVEKFYGKKFDIIICRAFSPLGYFVRITQHLMQKRGFWIAMKGDYPYLEISDVPKNIIIQSVDKLFVPNIDKQRHAVIMKLKEVI